MFPGKKNHSPSFLNADSVQMQNLPTWPPGASFNRFRLSTWFKIGSNRDTKLWTFYMFAYILYLCEFFKWIKCKKSQPGWHQCQGCSWRPWWRPDPGHRWRGDPTSAHGDGSSAYPCQRAYGGWRKPWVLEITKQSSNARRKTTYLATSAQALFLLRNSTACLVRVKPCTESATTKGT